MEDTDRFLILQNQLNRYERGRRKAEATLWLPRGLLAGLFTGLIFALLIRFFPLMNSRSFSYLAALLAISGMVITLLVIAIRRRTLIEKALHADRSLGLSERASTAVEINTGKLIVAPSMRILQLDDTLIALSDADSPRDIPLNWNWREISLILLIICLLTGAMVLPNPQSEIVEQRVAVSSAIEGQLDILEELQEEITQNELLEQSLREILKAPVSRAIESLEAGDLSREQAVAIISEAEADLRELNATLKGGTIDQSLSEAGRSLVENPNAQNLGEAFGREDLFGAAEAAGQMVDLIPGLNDRERAALAQDLAQSAAAMQEIDPEIAAELLQAAQAIQAGDIGEAQQSLDDASAVLQERAQQEAAANLAESAAGQLDQSGQKIASAGQPSQTDSQDDSARGDDSNSGENPGTGDDQSQRLGSEETSEQGQGPDGPGAGGGRAESVFVPALLDLTSEQGVDLELPAYCVGDLDNCGMLLSESPTEFGSESSLVPYQRVFADYRDSAFEALEGDYIPLGMKGTIRDYFTNLEP